MQVTLSRRLVLVCAAVLVAAVLLPLGARGAATRYHDDSLWANALGSLGGTNRPGDFGYVFLPAADNVLSGRDLYMDPDLFRGPPQAPYAYPPVLAILVTPLAVLPEKVAGVFVPGVLFTLLLIAATIGALLLLDVRDWRCYPVALLYPLTVEAVEYGAVGPILLLLVALLWRFRDRRAIAGVATGGAVVLKLFLWPLVFWLVVTRRAGAATVALATAIGLALASWAAIGFSDVLDYPRLLRKLADVEAENSYSAFAILRTAGVADLVAQAIVIAAGASLLVLAGRAARSADDPQLERDRRSLILTLAAALVLTPILWLHYLVLLIVPIALARPRLSLLWLAPLALTVFEALNWYRGWPAGDAEALISVAACVAVVLVASLRRPETAVEGRREPASAF